MVTALARLTGRCTGRALATQAGVPAATAARILADLVEAGVVEARPAGRATLYCLNRDHLTARAITELAGLRYALVDDLRRGVAKWDYLPLAAWLFGSTARADGDRASDIDLFFIAPATVEPRRWQQQLGDLASHVESLTGNDVQMVEHTLDSFLALEASLSPLTKALRIDGIELVDGCWSAIAKSIT
jgi:predicted nucleotidyltransferase